MEREAAARPAPTTINMDPPDNYQTTYDSKTKVVVFYSLSIAFNLISGSKFRDDIYPNILKVGKSILLYTRMHAHNALSSTAL